MAPRGAWVALSGFIGSSPNLGGALLHWTGSKWVNVNVPSPTLGLGPLARDGRGGLWLVSSSSTSFCLHACDVNAMFHYNAGTWSKTPIHVPGLAITGMRLIPGTTSVWASGTNVAVPGGQGDTVGVMLKYGP